MSLPVIVATATSYTTSLGASSGNTGTGVLVIFTPVGGNWPTNEVITPTLSGVTGSFSPTTISASGSSSVTCTFTPTQTGTASISSTTSPSMTNTTGALSYTVSTGGGNGTPPALTGLQFVQYGAIAMPDLSEAVSGAIQAPIGTITPVGGVGPYTFALSNNPLGYRLLSTTKRGILSNPYIADTVGGTTDTVTCTITDAVGQTYSGTITVDKSATAPLLWAGPLDFPHNQTDPFYGMSTYVYPVGTGHDLNDTVNITSDPSGLWTFSYGALKPTVIPSVGSYTLGISATGSGGTLNRSITIQITDGSIPGPIYFTPGTVSTSMNNGSVVGVAACTTPNNSPAWSLTDNTGTIQIDISGTVTVRKTPQVGTLPFSITCSENGSTYSQNFSLTVVQGTVVPSDNMSMTVNSSLVNVGRGQSVGTATVTGITGTPSWSLVQENYNTTAIQNETVGYLFHIDPSTGVVTAPGLLMAKNHTLIVSCTDGINTCTKSFTAPVAWAPVVRTVWVGQGMVAAHGADGFEHLVDARDQFNTDVRTGTIQLNLVANADDNYYADDTGTLTGDYAARFPWQGPIIVTGIAANGKLQPRTGGNTNMWSNTGGDMRGKGFWVFGDGDAILENVEVSHCFGSDQTHGGEAVRKDGETYGNFTMRNCYIHDCDEGFLSGIGGSDLTFYGNEVVGCGTSHVSAGASHNFYIGEQWSVTAYNNYSVMAMTGHDFKCRAVKGNIHDNRFYDLERGGASCCIDLPNGGDYTVTNNKVQKGPMAQNPYTIQYAAEFDNTKPDYKVHNLVVSNNQIAVMTMAGAHWGTPAAVRHFMSTDYYGNPTTVTVSNNSIWLAPHATVLSSGPDFTVSNPAPQAGRTTESGTTLLSAPPALDFTRPFLSGSMPRMGWYRVTTQWGGDSYANYDGVQIDPGSDDLVVSHTATAGTVLGTMWASVALDDNGGTPTNPFIAGTTWLLSQAGVYYPITNENPWAPTNTFTVTTNSDGSGTLKVGSLGLSPGVYYIQPQATAPNSTVALNRFYVTVT